MQMSSDDFAPEHRVGAIIDGKWRVERLLGVGSVASAFAAVDQSSGARVAIKVLHPELVEDPALRARFLREARLAGSIDHPAIVRVLADGTTEDGAPFLVMEFIDGETIDARMRRKGGKLPMREALWIADAALDVLIEAHALGIVHRDVRVENLFLTSDHAVKLIDFGVARVRRAAEHKAAAEIGAKGADEGEVDDDLWGVGAAMYTMVVGEPVLEGQSRADLLHAPGVEVPSLAKAAPELPAAFAKLVDRALSLAPAAGWPDARAMQSSVRDVVEMVRTRPSHPHVASPFSAPMPEMPRGEMKADVPGAPSTTIALDVTIPKPSAVPSEAMRRARGADGVSGRFGTISFKWAVVVIGLAVVLGGVAALVLGR